MPGSWLRSPGYELQYPGEVEFIDLLLILFAWGLLLSCKHERRDHCYYQRIITPSTTFKLKCYEGQARSNFEITASATRTGTVAFAALVSFRVVLS